MITLQVETGMFGWEKLVLNPGQDDVKNKTVHTNQHTQTAVYDAIFKHDNKSAL